jgi:aminopeptidase
MNAERLRRHAALARSGVNGTVSATMPFSHQGALIEGMTVRFSEGRVVGADARTGRVTPEHLLRTDEGAARLGEVALVSQGSAVSRLGTLFYNALFDENAACHLALGQAYPRCLQGGEAMEPADLERRGANRSMAHVDFMVGSPDLDIDGVAADGAIIPVTRGGGWAFGS